MFRPHPAEAGLELSSRDLPELPPYQVASGDWPCWRGPKQDNHSPDNATAQSWSETSNVVWKSAIHGRGHSTPILVGSRIVVTGADESTLRQFAHCLERTTGATLWETTVHEGGFPAGHPDNSFASGTPAADGERFFTVFACGDAVRVTALDLEGRVLWQTEAGPHGGEGSHGSGMSPTVCGAYVIVSDESPNRGWVAALHRQTGEIAWRKDRESPMGSYGSPIVAPWKGQTLLLLAGGGRITAYEPKRGDVVWERDGLAEVTAGTAAVSDSMVFASSGYPFRKLLALRSDGSVAWKRDYGNDIPYPPSMVCHGGHLYVVSDQGLASCFNAETGKQCWKERLRGGYYSSPLVVGNHIYACNRDGATTIFEASPDGFVEVAKNKLDGGINASPVAVGGKLYIRTETHLYCIGK